MLQTMSCAARAPGRSAAGRLASAIVQRTQRRHAASSALSAPSTSSSSSSSSNGGQSPPPPPPAAASSRARAFLEIERKSTAYRPASDRVQDWGEIFPAGDSTQQPEATAAVRAEQASRCMDCGTPFCQTHTGCPIHNLIPEFNSLAADGEWKRAWESLRSTNNFPEFTSRVCPAPCEGACVAGLVPGDEPITIKNTEQAIVDRAWEEGWVRANPPKTRTGLRVVVIGSGPAGLAAADELNQMGHLVRVHEREDTVGGLLQYGIPNMKLDKRRLAQRVSLLEQEGVEFHTNSAVGEPGGADAHALRASADAVVIAVGSTVPRDLEATAGREGPGVHFAMEYLTKSQKALRQASKEGVARGGRGLASSAWGGEDLDAGGKHVVVIGGGDTGTDCIGTSLRQDCKSMLNLEIVQRPPDERDAAANPWPAWPRIFRVDYGHAEAAHVFGADPREFGASVLEFVREEGGGGEGGGQGKLKALKIVSVDEGFEPIEGTEREVPCDLALLAMGFVHPERQLVDAFSLETTRQTDNIDAPYDGAGAYKTNVDGVFAAGDCRRGQSLVVWAINEGRNVATAVHQSFKDRNMLRSKGDTQKMSSSLETWMGGSFFSP